MAEQRQASFASRVAGQGALLFAGFAGAQALSLLRNVILAHWLSMGDFGVAAAILMILQTVEVLSDVGVDRLIVQASDGDEPGFAATAHLALLVRGLAIFLVIVASAVPIAKFFGVPAAAWAFATAGAAPLIKSFLHLDARRAQRRLDNRPQIMIEVLPQLAALALAIPMILATGDYSAAVWLSLVQATIAVWVSHAMAERPYRIALDRSYAMRIAEFGWPIWASAFPLVAVYHGDRMAIGHLADMEQLAAYTAAFMATMVPGLLASKVGNALVLPLLAGVVSDRDRFARRFALTVEVTAIAAAAFFAGFAIAGGPLLAIAFGERYAGLDTVVTLLALMWSMRMLQASFGMPLMAEGITRPFLFTGLIRSLGVGFAIAALLDGHGLEGAAAGGAAAEFLSLCYVLRCLGRVHRDTRGRLHTAATKRSLMLLPVAGVALLVSHYTASAGQLTEIAAAALVVAGVIAAGVIVMPGLSGALRWWRAADVVAMRKQPAAV